MIFSEIYGLYYKCVEEILKEAVKKNINACDIRQIVRKYAFSESISAVESALLSQKWLLLKGDGKTSIKHAPSIPITKAEKMWLKAILSDRRIKLFDIDIDGLDDTEPLFTENDYCIFDRYGDGDPYDDKEYIKNFKLILNAVRNNRPLKIGIKNRKNMLIEIKMVPEHLEYSEKDDKFRLICRETNKRSVINLGRIVYCETFYGKFIEKKKLEKTVEKQIKIELTNKRNALERAMLHFSHFKKEAVQIDRNKYRLIIYYDSLDETELLIRVLSFGPLLKVTEPDSFIKQIKKRLERQSRFLGVKQEQEQ